MLGSIKSKLLLVQLMVLAMFVAASVLSITNTNKLLSNLLIIKERPLTVTRAILSFRTEVDNIENLFLEAAFSNDLARAGQCKTRIGEIKKDASANLEIVKERILGEDGKEKAKEVEKIFREVDKHKEALFSIIEKKGFEEAKRYNDREIKKYFEEFIRVIVVVRDHASQKSIALSQEAMEISRRGKERTITILMVSILISLILIWKISKSILSRIDTVKTATHKMAEGDLSQRVPVSGNDEMTELSRSVNIMAEKLQVLYDSLDQKVKERTAELEQKNEEMERIMYTVSHDLKSPLITIKGFIGFAQEDVDAGNKEKFKKDMGKIGNAADKMSLLLDQILHVSRIGRVKSEMRDVLFSELVTEAVELVEGRIRERGVRVEIQPDMPMLRGEKHRLVEMLQNLIENAVKFMGNQSSPKITIGCIPGEMDIFFVKDNGCGIEEKYQHKVFGLFDKLDSNTEGTGIGLSIVKRTVEMHGGKIWIESEGRDKGTTFWFTLPNRKG